MKNKPFTRNQKISITGIIVVFVFGILGLFVKINIEIKYIQEEIENIKIEKADIKSLVVDEFLKTCPHGTTTTTIEFTDQGIKFGCVDQ